MTSPCPRRPGRSACFRRHRLEVGTTAIEAVDKFYKARNWFNCAVGGNCAQTEARIEVMRVINELGALLEKASGKG